MPYNIQKSKAGYKVHYKKNGKMHTVPGASSSIARGCWRMTS